MVSCEGEYHIRFNLICFCIGVHPIYDPRKFGEEKGIVYFKEKAEEVLFIWLVWGFFGGVYVKEIICCPRETFPSRENQSRDADFLLEKELVSFIFGFCFSYL